MAFTTYDKLLVEFNDLKETLKARSMIYQADAKEETALRLGLNINAFIMLSYADWNWVNTQVATLNAKAEQRFDSHPQEFPGMTVKTTFGEIWAKYDVNHPNELNTLVSNITRKLGGKKLNIHTSL